MKGRADFRASRLHAVLERGATTGENMKIAKEVRKGEVIPEWYGVAWVRWEVDEAICYPMPLNLLIAAARAIAIWMRYGYRAVPYNARDAYAQGLRDGKRSNAGGNAPGDGAVGGRSR